MKTILQSVALGLMAMTACLLTGCGSAKPDAMMPVAVTAAHRSGKAILAQVVGGSETTPMGGSGITNEEFKLALESSLVKSGLFSNAGPGGYQLEAFIADIDQPVIGFSMRVNLDVSYTLRRGGSTIWRKSIRSTYVAATGEAFAGALRLRKATEGAARENIASLIRALDGQQL
jgi:hypothetical protein